ncbi:MAG: GTP-binding protein [Rhodothermales bacterium]
MAAQPSGAPVPITILSGFLGAGKTTLLNHLLRQANGRRIAVLVNDFGSINIDADLVQGQTGEVLQLAGGCVCCSMQTGLLNAVAGLLEQPEAERPEHILIEASGVAEPASIAFAFIAPSLRHVVRLDGIVTVVDAVRSLEPARLEVAHLIQAQLDAANLIVLNKTELVTPEQLADLREGLGHTAPQARILEAQHAAVPATLLLGLHGDRLELPDAPVDHTHPFASWSYTADQPFETLGALKRALRALPETVIRAKGFAWVAERLDRMTEVHVVGQQVMFTFHRTWGERAPSTQLVFIGMDAGDEATVRDALDGIVQAMQA